MSNNQIKKKNLLIICRGAGDLATGIIHRLHRAGHRVIALETDYPAAIRRQVSFCELPGEERNIEDEHWVEYGTQTLDAGPCGSSGRTPSPPGRPWTWAGPGPSPGRRVRPIP